MKLLGRVKLVSHEGYLIVKGSFAPESNSTVVDGRKHRVGRVVKVFGPVRTPYVAIRPESGLRPLTVIGQEVYTPPEGEHAEAKGRDGADRKVPRMQQRPSGKGLRAR